MWLSKYMACIPLEFLSAWTPSCFSFIIYLGCFSLTRCNHLTGDPLNCFSFKRPHRRAVTCVLLVAYLLLVKVLLPQVTHSSYFWSLFLDPNLTIINSVIKTFEMSYSESVTWLQCSSLWSHQRTMRSLWIRGGGSSSRSWAWKWRAIWTTCLSWYVVQSQILKFTATILYVFLWTTLV